ncbi:MAG TPA: NUDIX domain-containing protein [Candidatus Binatia bacterium]|nr:NUDIX domain-containing protein [Candidatus Binatia bacterium]
MSELVDIVNDEGHVLRVLSRKAAHQRGLMHRAVRVLLFNKRGEVFVQQRAQSKDINPGLWEGSLAGHQLHGEEAIHAAVRETKEELGMAIPKSRFKRLGNFLVKNAKDHLFYTLYSVRGVAKTPKLNAEEVASGHWEPVALVTRHTRMHPHRYTPGFLVAWHLFRKYHPK